jgi:hypothetical protein
MTEVNRPTAESPPHREASPTPTPEIALNRRDEEGLTQPLRASGEGNASAVYWGVASSWRSCLREETSSLRNARPKCVSTVFSVTNSD